MQQNFSHWVTVLIVVGILIGLGLLFKGRDRKRTEDGLAVLCRYFDNANTARVFPTVELTVTPKKGEFGLINELANLYEMRARRQSVGVSFRVARGVYVGKRAYVSP
jgi:hypothetical protein